DHIAECETCRRELAGAGLGRRIAALRDELRAGHPAPDHLEFAQSAGLLNGTLDAASQAAAREHIEDCAQCADELEDLRAFRAPLVTSAASAPAASVRAAVPVERRERAVHARRSWQWVASAALSAAAAGFAVWLADAPARRQLARAREELAVSREHA